LRVQPTLEILNADLVLDLGVIDDDRDYCLTPAQVANPITVVELVLSKT
jgi:hypothetical protein